MSRHHAFLMRRVISATLLLLLVGLWGLSIWSHFWLKVPAVIESVSYGEVHIEGETVRNFKQVHRIAERDIASIEVRYRFYSAGLQKTGSRIQIGVTRLEGQMPFPPLKQGDHVSVLLPYEGSDYSVLYSGLSALDLIFANLIVLFWLFLPVLIDRFFGMVSHTLELRK